MFILQVGVACFAYTSLIPRPSFSVHITSSIMFDTKSVHCMGLLGWLGLGLRLGLCHVLLASCLESLSATSEGSLHKSSRPNV